MLFLLFMEAAEAIFEYVSIDKLLEPKNVSSIKDWLWETLRQAKVEASEEMFTEVANILSDAAIMGQRSDWAQMVQQYKSKGMSGTEAKKRAFLDCVGQVMWASAGGALSGGIMGGAVSAFNYNSAVEEAGATHELPGPLFPTLEEGGPTEVQVEKTPPDRVKAKTATVQNRGEAASVVQQLKENIPTLKEETPVAEVSMFAVDSAAGKTMAEKASALFSRIKGIVTRHGFGDVEINDKAVKDDLSHGIGPAKAAVIPAIPAVIQHGIQIDFQENWKGRAYDGYIFAAPVMMDGQIVYVAAVVKQTSKNRFYLHEVVDSNGNIIKISNEERANPTSPVADGDAGTQSSLLIDDIMSEIEKKVKEKSARLAEGYTQAEQELLQSDGSDFGYADALALLNEAAAETDIQSQTNRQYDDLYRQLYSQMQMMGYNDGMAESLDPDLQVSYADAMRQAEEWTEIPEQPSSPTAGQEPTLQSRPEGRTIKTTPRIGKKRPKLSKQEWRQVQSAQMQMYAGMDEDSIPEIGYVFAHNQFYFIRNYGLGAFEVSFRLDPATDQDAINNILEGERNENDK